MTQKKEIVVKEELAIKTYSLDKPQEMIQMATVLKSYIIKQKLYTEIQGKNYVMVDGWAFAGFLTGLISVVEEPKDLSSEAEIKYSCTAKIYQGEKVVGSGFALCSNKERSKKSFDEYAILSMAQTRALGKAYRNKIGWIIKLAGYESTPSEEMDGIAKSPINAQNESTGDLKLPKDTKAQITYLLSILGIKGGSKEETQAIIKEKTGIKVSDKPEDLIEIRNRLEVLVKEAKENN